MNIELLFNLANLSYLAGTLLLIKKVIKNRNSLNDFDYYGSTINFIGMFINTLALLELKLYSTIIISLPTMLFWAMAAIFSFRTKR